MNSKKEIVNWLHEMTPLNEAYVTYSGATYDNDIRELEACLRSFWGIIPLFMESNSLEQPRLLKKFIQKVEQKHLPEMSTQKRQIAVEIGVLGFLLGHYREKFLGLFSKGGQEYFIDWLNGINAIEIPYGNWYFFVVLVNAGLKASGSPYSEKKLTEAKQHLETMYLGDGWYFDGDRNQMDYYIPFGFHFYGLLYATISEDEDARLYRERARKFATIYPYYFDEEGRSIPFGRSLTYRFAHVSFWVAILLSGEYKNTVWTIGQIKQLIFQNFRYWKKQQILETSNHHLMIGYSYANLLLSEDYNAPGSPMWAFKSFLLLMLPDNHLFWKAKEGKITSERGMPLLLEKPKIHLMWSSERTSLFNHFTYSKNLGVYHQNEKYGKFVYSSYFGFNLSRDSSSLEHTAIDSTLGFSINRESPLAMRGAIDDSFVYPDYGVSEWHVLEKVLVRTYLIPLTVDLHFRIHEVSTPFEVYCIEGGFPLFEWNKKFDEPYVGDDSSKLKNRYGTSTIINLSHKRRPIVVVQGPNTNLYNKEKNAIPALETMLLPGMHHLFTLVKGTSEQEEKALATEVIETDRAYQVFIADKRIVVRKEGRQ
ncbi:DUF2264 domain-containing protein [Enterococcus camelliae]|uniref:DUF2264 domain-containing protein n=1 Tax=Enterococcus camelliae TaxID=453959 RepID=A0ABW5TIT2_9ENTE